MYLTSTGTVVAQLTRKGRQVLAENSAAFNITQFRFSDDEINYVFFDGSTIDAVNADLGGWPILEGCTNGDFSAGQRYSIFTADNNLISIAQLDTDIGYLRIPPDRIAEFVVAGAVGNAGVGNPFGQGGNFSSAPFIVGQQENRPERSNADLTVEYDSATPGQEYSFLVKTLYGQDNNYLVSFGTSNPPFTVNGSYQSIFTTIPDTDPSTTFQNQSQTTITFKLNGSFRTAADRTIIAPDGSSNPWVQTNMNIVGQQTGQRFSVSIWFWSRSLALDWFNRTGGGTDFGREKPFVKPPKPADGTDAKGTFTWVYDDTVGVWFKVYTSTTSTGSCPPGFHKDANGVCVANGTGQYWNTCTQMWQNTRPPAGCRGDVNPI